jgi:hypothetical protein
MFEDNLGVSVSHLESQTSSVVVVSEVVGVTARIKTDTRARIVIERFLVVARALI